MNNMITKYVCIMFKNNHPKMAENESIGMYDVPFQRNTKNVQRTHIELWELNDIERLSFNQIADLIDKYL